MARSRSAKPSASRKVKTPRSLSDLIPDPRNANRGNRRGADVLASSLNAFGAGRSVLADRHGVLIAGNKTLQAAAAAGMTDVIVVPSDGSKLVVVQRVDLDLSKDKRAKALAVADNRTAELGLTWDDEVLAQLQAEGCALGPAGFSDLELKALAADDSATAVEDGEDEIPEKFAVLVTCRNEREQVTLIERLTKEGRECRALLS